MKVAASIAALCVALASAAGSANVSKASAAQEKLDRDLPEISIPQLEALYSRHKYTVTQVVGWYIDRIKRYNGIYRAVQTLDVAGALAAAGRLDAEAKAGGIHFVRGP